MGNIRYYFRETIRIFNNSLLSNLFSIFSTGLIFFLLALVIAGYMSSQASLAALKNEAEMSVYYSEGISQKQLDVLLFDINQIKGVKQVAWIDADHAYKKMADVLGGEASVLSYFDENPFTPFIEVKINIEAIDLVYNELSEIESISTIRNNRDVLDKLAGISKGLSTIGLLILVAVGISTIVIISHIIRQGIYENREQIETLKLLGAPLSFIGIPYLMIGFMIVVIGSCISLGLMGFVIDKVYTEIVGPLPFIPMPDKQILFEKLVLFIFGTAASLGLVGSLLGLKSKDL